MASPTAAMTVTAAKPSPLAVIWSQRQAGVNALSTQKSADLRLSGRVSASPMKEQVVAGMTAAAVAAAMVMPAMAEAAQPGLSPSLNNFLLSIASGGAVLAAIIGAVVGVSNFDPVKRI